MPSSMEVGSLLDALLEPDLPANTEVSSPLLVCAPHLCLQTNLSFTSFMSDLWCFKWKTNCEMSSYEGGA